MINQPTVAELTNTVVSQIEAAIGQTVPLLPKSFIRVLAKVIAGAFILLYKYIGFASLQSFVSTASDQAFTVNGIEVIPLREWGRLVGIGEPEGATQAEMNLTVTVVTPSGTLPINTQLIGALNGVTYVTTLSVAITGATFVVPVRAVDDQSGGDGFGAVGNLSPGDVVSFVNPLPAVSRDTVVLAALVTGAEQEASDNYRQRVLDRFQKQPQGGAYADYEQWAEEVAGILHAYPYTGSPGEVDVYTEATVESSGSPDGIPTGSQLTAVLDNINYNQAGIANRRNANAFVNSLPITRTSFDVDVVGIAGVVDLAQVEDDIETALKEYFLAAEPFIPGLTVPPRRDTLTRVRLSALVEDIVSAANGTFTSAAFYITTTSGSLPTYILAEGEKAKMTTVNFV